MVEDLKEADPREWIREEQLNRLFRLLSPHVKAEDNILSDAELVYRVKQRFDLHWRLMQALIDPSE